MHRGRALFAALALFLLLGCKDKKATVVLRNTLGTDVTVTVDHKDVVIAGNQAVVLELAPGDYEMTANGLMLLETKTVSLKTTSDTAIYNIGGRGDLALVSVPENGGELVVRPLTAPLTMLEPTEMLVKPNLNEKLPAKGTAKAGMTGYYLCSYDVPTKAVGCTREK